MHNNCQMQFIIFIIIQPFVHLPAAYPGWGLGGRGV